MTRVTTCDDCGEREPTRYQQDGVCRECRGIKTRTRNHRVYVSPDEAERNSEALDHAEQQSRARVVQNDRFQSNE